MFILNNFIISLYFIISIIFSSNLLHAQSPLSITDDIKSDMFKEMFGSLSDKERSKKY